MTRRVRSGRLSRRPASGPPRPRVTVVAEGENTEPEYVRAFARLHGAATVVSIEGEGRDPLAVVRKAIALHNDQPSSYGQADSVWAVFDRDQHLRFTEAKVLAEQHGIGLAVSNPCFELWAIFHYQDQDAPIDADACQRLLQSLCSTYQKDRGKLFTEEGVIVDNYGAAVARAKRSLERREQEGDPEGNPSTSMHQLTEHILKIMSSVP